MRQHHPLEENPVPRTRLLQDDKYLDRVLHYESQDLQVNNFILHMYIIMYSTTYQNRENIDNMLSTIFDI